VVGKAAQVHNLVMRYAVRGVHHIEAEMRLAVHEVPHTEAEMHFVVDVRVLHQKSAVMAES